MTTDACKEETSILYLESIKCLWVSIQPIKVADILFEDGILSIPGLSRSVPVFTFFLVFLVSSIGFYC